MSFDPVNSSKPEYKNWYNKPAPLRIRSSFYRFLSKVIKPFDKDRSDLYKFRATRTDRKKSHYAQDKAMKNLFKEKWVARAMNIAATPTLKEFKQMKKNKKNLTAEAKASIQSEYPDAKVTHKPIESFEIGGICLGVFMDLSKNYLKKPQTKEETRVLLTTLAKGGSLNAEINQAAHKSLSIALNKEDYEEALLSLLKPNANSPLSSELLPANEQHVTLLRSSLLSPEWILGSLTKITIKRDLKKKDQLFLPPSFTQLKTNETLHYIKAKVAKDLGSLLLDSQNKPNFSAIQEAYIKEINTICDEKIAAAQNTGAKKQLLKQKLELVSAIKFAVAIEEYSTGLIVSDPLLKEIFSEIHLYADLKALASANGFSLKTPPDIASHLHYLDDAAYLTQLDKLKQPGLYGIKLSMPPPNKSHMLYLNFDEDGSGHICDINKVTLAFKDIDDAITQLQLLINQYPQPYEGLSRPNHKLVIFEASPLSKLES